MIALTLIVFTLFSEPVAAAATQQTAAKTVWSGVYTDEQAARGKLEYAQHCQRCHGIDLTDSREIVGAKFLERWREDRLDTLFNYVKVAMPRGNGGSLTDDTYILIFSYVLARNGFPAGNETL